MDLFPLSSMNLKPGWESCCPNTGAEHRGTTESTHSLSLCPFRHRVLLESSVTPWVCQMMYWLSHVAPCCLNCWQW